MRFAAVFDHAVQVLDGAARAAGARADDHEPETEASFGSSADTLFVASVKKATRL
eukprot:m.443123 g.443123  ORF g.443123 m.443123 type:complete len:55 (+) comp20291_c1_seq5:202-366(+)